MKNFDYEACMETAQTNYELYKEIGWSTFLLNAYRASCQAFAVADVGREFYTAVNLHAELHNLMLKRLEILK